MQGYITRKGVVFTTTLRVVTKAGNLEVEPRIVAEPGDLINIEGSLLYNLSRAALGDPRVVHNADESMFVRVSPN